MKCGWLAVVLLLSAVSVRAEADPLDTVSQLSLKDLLDVEVVVASLHNETLMKTPSSVTVFTREQIKKMGVSSVEELLNYVPGFQSSRDTFVNQGSRVGARGLLNAQPSYSILFLIDGHRLNTDLSAGALIANRYLTTANIARVEVIRGPGSALYGSSALSGVVNIITVKGINEAYLGAGSLNGREARVNMYDRGEDLEVSAFVRFYSDEGQAYGADLTTPVDDTVFGTTDPYSAMDAYASVSWRERVTVNLRHSDRKLEEFFGFRLVTPGLPEANTRQDSVVVQLKTIVRSDAGLDLQLGYTQDETTTVDELGPQIGTYEYENSEWELKTDGFIWLANNNLRGGLSLRRASVDKYAFTPLSGGDALPQGKESSRNIVGAYIQDQVELATGLTATAGLRFDWISKLDRSVNPRAALVYTPVDTSSIKLMYGEAFRVPSRFQLDDIFFGNSDIESEEVSTLELAWLQDFKHYLPSSTGMQTALTWFNSRHKHRIELVPGGSFGLIADNASGVLETSGFELEATMSYGERFSLHLAYTHLIKTEQDPESFADGSYSVIAQYDASSWFANLNGVYKSETEHIALVDGNLVAVDLDRYWDVKAVVGLNMGTSSMVKLTVNNLFDETYYSPSSIPDFPGGLENRGRTYMLGIEHRF